MTESDALLLARVRRQREIAKELMTTERAANPELPIDELIDLVDQRACEMAAGEEHRALGDAPSIPGPRDAR